MFKLNPFISDKIWGYEHWIVSTLQGGLSICDDDKETLDKKLGGDYPLLLKIIQANSVLSVQVHPEDEYAKRIENSFGKTECWYILDAQDDANLICGLHSTYSRDELSHAIIENKLENFLYSVPVKKGDFVFIPAGTVHAITGGLRILEVQQPSDVTYRLYDWGRGRELHVEKSLDVIEHANRAGLQPYSLPIKEFSNFSCEYFTLEKIEITETLTTKVTKNTIFIVLAGKGSVSDTTSSLDLIEENTLFVCCNEEVTFNGALSLMKVFET